VTAALVGLVLCYAVFTEWAKRTPRLDLMART
jgi:hypothetical protein